MSKNITIKEGGIGRNFTAMKVRTTLVNPVDDVNTCNWIPEDEMGEKTITRNGEYLAEDDSVPGYSKVTVDVPQSGGDTWEDILDASITFANGSPCTATITKAEYLNQESGKYMFFVRLWLDYGEDAENSSYIASVTLPQINFIYGYQLWKYYDDLDYGYRNFTNVAINDSTRLINITFPRYMREEVLMVRLAPRRIIITSDIFARPYGGNYKRLSKKGNALCAIGYLGDSTDSFNNHTLITSFFSNTHAFDPSVNVDISKGWYSTKNLTYLLPSNNTVVFNFDVNTGADLSTAQYDIAGFLANVAKIKLASTLSYPTFGNAFELNLLSAIADEVGRPALNPNLLLHISGASIEDSSDYKNYLYASGTVVIDDGAIKLESDSSKIYVSGANLYTAPQKTYYTIETDIKFSTNSSSTQIFGVLPYRGTLLELYSGKLHLNVGDSGGNSWKKPCVTDNTVPINQWIHVKVVREDTEFSLYVDDELVASGTCLSTDGTYKPANYVSSSNETRYLCIGDSGNGNRHPPFWIRDFKIWAGGNAEKGIKAIKIETPPTKLNYTKNDSNIDLTGINVFLIGTNNIPYIDNRYSNSYVPISELSFVPTSVDHGTVDTSLPVCYNWDGSDLMVHYQSATEDNMCQANTVSGNPAVFQFCALQNPGSDYYFVVSCDEEFTLYQYHTTSSSSGMVLEGTTESTYNASLGKYLAKTYWYSPVPQQWDVMPFVVNEYSGDAYTLGTKALCGELQKQTITVNWTNPYNYFVLSDTYEVDVVVGGGEVLDM